ncbi:MAG: hypothetical protein IKU07_02775 [Oscillospiraceae bacterium]|nr:hypothetical protein [Oscillospiraceae bacterium]
MALLILSPENAAAAYTLAAQAFQTMYQKVTGQELSISLEDDGCSDLIVIGSDSVNDYLMAQVLELKISSLPIRYGTDDYCIQSHNDNGRKILIFAGGRGRSTIYAVYDYFERFAGCHYFWDGDVIPHCDTLPMDNISVSESPRFQYRGTRYFAHRSLKRFQAEHWNIDDWKQELDWLVKKRMNFFMLRIGMDDIWQKAFPQEVPYPDGYQTMNAAGFHDRSDFWTLKFRSQLRSQIMQYARDLDLSFPVDCGTMTHWYSRTPQSFIDTAKPSFVTQEVSYYADGATGSVFDFRKKEMMAYYTKLTDTMLKEYDQDSSLFHTIGLGERSMYTDPKKNFALKKIAYRRIAEEIRTKYPHAKLMLATWDFAGWWNADQVEALTRELDPERTIFLDYTCEVADPKSSFLNWGLVNKFPWIFGIFHAFESESELRGPYDRIRERFSVAVKDPMCQGMIYWPELSHSDPLILEYLTENCWQPSEMSIEQIIHNMCVKRYGNSAEPMSEAWQTAMPVIKLGDWGSRTQRDPQSPNYEDYANMTYTHTDLWTRFTLFLIRPDSEDPILRKFFNKRIQKYEAVKGAAALALNQLPRDIDPLESPMVFRDVADIVRTMLGRYMNLIIMVATDRKGETETLQKLQKVYQLLMDIAVRLLGICPDFSMAQTLEALRETAPVNPNFEITLKHNLCNNYCLQAAFEPAKLIYQKETEYAFSWLMSEDMSKEALTMQREALIQSFLDTPLSDVTPNRKDDISELITLAANAITEAESILFP